jgi:hypothetical protein
MYLTNVTEWRNMDVRDRPAIDLPWFKKLIPKAFLVSDAWQAASSSLALASLCAASAVCAASGAELHLQ